MPGNSHKPLEHDHVGREVRDVAWDVLASDPTVGLSIVDEDARTLFCNARAAEYYLGPGGTPDKCLGLDWASALPPKAVDLRKEILAKAREHQGPIVVRTILGGLQIYAVIYPIPPRNGERMQFVHILRSVPGGASEYFRSMPLIETEEVDLGPLNVLSPRELEVLALVGQNLSSKAIGAVLHRSEKTIENHRYAISKKLKGASAVELASIARQAGLTLKDATRRKFKRRGSSGS
jgi:DNA-binding CsgD family transcriptional regulator